MNQRRSIETEIPWAGYEPIVLGKHIDLQVFSRASAEEQLRSLQYIAQSVRRYSYEALAALLEFALRSRDHRIRGEACYLVRRWSEIDRLQAARFASQIRWMGWYEKDSWVRDQAAKTSKRFAIVDGNRIDIGLFKIADTYSKLRVLRTISQQLVDFNDRTLQILTRRALHDLHPAVRFVAYQRLKRRVSPENRLQAAVESILMPIFRIDSRFRYFLHILRRPEIPRQDGRISAAIVDTPTTVDLLDYLPLASTIATRAASVPTKNTPLVIGIYGEWGSGKTSLLQMVSAALREQDIYPIWFEAWKYDNEDNLWSALLQTILDQAALSGRWYRRVYTRFRILWGGIDPRAGLWELAKKLRIATKKTTLALIRGSILVLCIGVVVLGWPQKEIQELLSQIALGPLQSNSAILSRIITSIAALIVFLAANPEELLKLFSSKLEMDLPDFDFSKIKRKQTYREHIAFLDEFSEDFERIIKLVGGGKPLVVIIDDLDRCLPEKAVQVLEALKLFLHMEGCVFLLAADQEVVERAIAVKYGDVINVAKDMGEDASELATFLGKKYFEKLVQLPLSIPPLSDEAAARFVNSLCPEDERIELICPVLVKCLPRNPRKIKRNLRLFLFLSDLAELYNKDIESSLLARLVVIQDQFPLLYKDIVKSPWLLWTLETFFGDPNRFDASTVKLLATTKSHIYEELTNLAPNVDLIDLIPTMVEQTKEIAMDFPKARLVFTIDTADGKRFVYNPIKPYVFFIQAMAEVESTRGSLRELSAGVYARRFSQSSYEELAQSN